MRLFEQKQRRTNIRRNKELKALREFRDIRDLKDLKDLKGLNDLRDLSPPRVCGLKDFGYRLIPSKLKETILYNNLIK